MNQDDYFFCGIGGSGMLPLALIVQAQIRERGGGRIEGSDRSRDQGRTPEKFAWLEAHGVTLHPQDGSGVTRSGQTVVVYSADRGSPSEEKLKLLSSWTAKASERKVSSEDQR